ncbi:MICAL-like protein 1 isoform X2 [Nasonia vitripennis]|uniref:MICAL-like protein 1 n=1 Tax=Nasonia vitripennis TaxID=7425 RepID=A0A7M7QIL4_NASVI|nr:MICAL-like protein 1 isoform X2 [Nasonia vitripennis]
MSGLLEQSKKSDVVVLRIDEDELMRRSRRASSVELEEKRLPALTRRASLDHLARREKMTDDESIVAELVSSRLGMRREPCASCGLPVFLAEKLVVSRSVYHRSCFRCARCRHQLTPGNYYETEDGQYCCEACPIDEHDHASHELSPTANDTTTTTTQTQLTSHRELTTDDLPEQQNITPTTTTTTTTTTNISISADTQQQQQLDSINSLASDSDQQQAAAVLEAPLSDEEKSKRRSLERSVDRLLQAQREKLEFVASHLLTDNNTADEQKLQHLEPADDKFDQMIKLINERIDELTTDEQKQEHQQQTPQQQQRRDARVHSAPNFRDDEEETPVLRRSSSLRSSPGEHTKDRSQEQPRRLSLVQRRLKLFEPDAQPSSPAPVAAAAEPPSTSLAEPPPAPVAPVVERVPGDDDKHDVVNSSSPTDEQDYPEDLNPFASDDDEEEVKEEKKKPTSTNPFGSDDDEAEEEQQAPPKPQARSRAPKKRLLEAPQINLNPFWSDDEEPQSDEPELRSTPVPKPRTLRHSHLEPRSNLTSSSIHSSNTSIASSCSTITPGGTYRKKKPAPPPPLLNASTPTKSPNPSLSPRLTPRTRKSKPAPPPPMPAAASTPRQDEQPVALRHPPDNEQQHVWDEEKLSKDEANRTTQSLSCVEPSYQLDKSLDGKWKRKKGPAPARPMPLRRKIKVMSMKDVKLELDQIEMQQQGLERQGVRLEQIIRDKCESGTASEDTSLGLDVEELVLELFALVNEKNELFRRQAELMLLRRQQRLEEEHADIEYQVRCLITQPEATKTDFDKQREETLIQRLVEIVERRNEIVECLEMDRRREIEEDRSIHREMDLYAARSKTDHVNMTDESRRSSKLKKGKIKEKIKEKKSKKSNKKDADKDVDETEAKLKRHSLRKWF